MTATYYAEANCAWRAVRRFAGSRPGPSVFARVLPHLDRLVYRITTGRHTAANLLSGLPVMMLTTTGARSGRPRTTPVLGLPAIDGIAVAAANFGRPDHPSWYYNLRANPSATLAVAGLPRQVTAVEADGAERERILREGLRIYPGWTQYERRAADRRIAIFLYVKPRRPRMDRELRPARRSHYYRYRTRSSRPREVVGRARRGRLTRAATGNVRTTASPT